MNHIHLIALGVRDMTVALQFYKGLGFQTSEKAEAPPIVFFNNGGSRLELFPLHLLMDDIGLTHSKHQPSSGFSGITFAHNVKSEQQVDECLALVVTLGGKIVKAAQPTAWGGYGGYFTDLDGYYWEVAYGESWVFDTQNQLIID